MQLNKPVTGNLLSQITKSILEDDESLTIEGYANTVSKDRMGDVIPMETWTKESALGNYKKNPIILAFHNHSKPIGKATDLIVTDMGLYIKAKISKAAGDVYNLIKEGILTTFSVGFMIKDATYDHNSDTFFINDVELTEVSVVSVPCNQDSVFSVSKSVDSVQLSSLKQQFSPVPDDKEKSKMSFDVEKLQAELAAIKNSTADAAVAAVKAAMDAQAAEKAAAEKAAAEKALAEKAIKDAARAEAAALVEKLQGELAAKDGAFAEIVKAQAEQIASLKDEIAQVVASRNNPLNPIAAGVKGSFGAPAQVNEKEIDRIVMLGMIKNVGMFETQYGKAHYETVTKAVNQSSSIKVSSDAYETVFSQNLMRDIQAELVVAPLFQEITMTSANMTIPINPGRGAATWVDAANFGTDASTGNEITVQLTERTLKTFKLAAKTYLTEETEEDTIMAILPILRSHLVEAHAAAIDTAFLRGTGSGQPKGLITQANAIAAGAATEVTTAKADGSVKVTAKMILAARRKLGLYGINLNEVTLVISQDAYWDLLLDSEWADVQQVGAEASVKLKGEVGNVYGMRVIVSNNFAAKAVSTAWGVLVNTSNFVVPRLREVTVKTDMDIVKDRRVFVATQRLNLEPLIEASAGNGKGVVQLTYAAT